MTKYRKSSGELRVGDERHKLKENLGNNIEELPTFRLKRL